MAKTSAGSKKKLTNRVTLYSNGIGHFCREYQVEAGKTQKIDIPVNQNDIGDVLASLQVFGAVRHVAPPSFTPVNSDTTSLVLDHSAGLRCLLKSLVGSKISLGGSPIQYTLCGMEASTYTTATGTVNKDYVVLLLDGSVKRVPVDEIESVNFLEDTVKSEIEKATANSFRRIKPNSTFLNIQLAGLDVDGEGKPDHAEVQYTIPVAAWKMRYSVRQDGDRFTLEGTAIIDNNSDEDWDDFIVSVVTGNPISFATDLAQIITPNRRFESVVDAIAQMYSQDGSSYLGGYGNQGVNGAQGNQGARGRANPLRSYGTQNYSGLEMTAGFAPSDVIAASCMAVAEAPGVDSKDVGDFCIFTAKEPISIASKRSAVVPMFTVPLLKTKALLMYKESNNTRRPYRALRFKNETEFSLGKGKVTIYRDNTFQGECVMDAAKPGESRMLPHAVENGVRIIKEEAEVESQQNSIQISKGVICEESFNQAVTTYTVDNRKDEEFKLLIEHKQRLYDSKTKFAGTEIKETEKIGDNVRAYVTLPANSKLTITATDTSIEEQTYTIQNPGQLKTVLRAKHPLLSNKEIQNCSNLQVKIDLLNEQVTQNLTRRNELVEQTNRVRENVKATKDEAASDIRKTWIEDLHKSETEIRRIETELVPQLQSKIKDVRAELSEALLQLSVQWKA